MTLCKYRCEDNTEVAELYRNEDGLLDAKTLSNSMGSWHPFTCVGRIKLFCTLRNPINSS